MPSGVNSGTAAFQRMLDNLLELVPHSAHPIVNDVIIVSEDLRMSYEELLGAHDRDVTRVLDFLGQTKMTGSIDQANTAMSEIVFAGHVVGNGQQKPIPGKVAAAKQ